MLDVQNKGFLDGYGLGIAAIGVFASENRAVISSGETVLTVLLLALMAGKAMAATVNHTSNCRKVPDPEVLDFAPGFGHSTDNLVSGHRRVNGVFPFIARGMQI
jgi:hypothetical protein